VRYVKAISCRLVAKFLAEPGKKLAAGYCQARFSGTLSPTNPEQSLLLAHDSPFLFDQQLFNPCSLSS
jgi:hypothetical protein